MIAGIDEVGRGCLAGPVLAAAVILDNRQPIPGLQDSKQLTAQQRERLAVVIRCQALSWSIGRAEACEIDQLNILQASLLAMARAYHGLAIVPNWVRVDGNRFPPIDAQGEAIIGGDASIADISAASILAKVARDREMIVADTLFPDYGFASHKGYPTVQHREALIQRGVLPIHRRSFAPVRSIIGCSQ